jgi:hypothetical protein
MNNYIEFIHEQSQWTTGITFENKSINDRLLKFEITTKDNFKYDGWYTYILYDELKTIEYDRGKVYLDDPKAQKTFDPIKKEKKIFKP